MSNQEEYELRIGVVHHPSLKTQQLRNFLTIESNDFLTNQLPQSLMLRQNFSASFEHVLPEDQLDLNEFVGLILLYSASSIQSFNFMKQFLQVANTLQNTFKLMVEMDNSQKQMNVVGSGGEVIANKQGLVFVRLNLYNSDELVNNINRNLYLMIENYYYPNEEQRQRPTSNYQVQASPIDFMLNYNSSEQKIVATSTEKEQVMDLIQKASVLRSSREKEMLIQQSAIDESIQNVESVLNNINRHIKSKLQSNWFTSLKDSLYKPVQKESKLFSKIKLTQEFIDQSPPQSHKKSRYFQSRAFKESINNSKYNYTLQQTLKKLDSSLLKIAILLDHNQAQAAESMIELQVFESSTYEELALNALRKLGLHQSERNHRIMTQKVKQKIETYIRQLSRKAKQLQRQRTFDRSYISVNKK